MDDPTYMRVPLDDETMAAVLEQAEAAKAPPRDVIAAVVRDAFLAMKAQGVVLARVEIAPAPPETNSRH